jgi:hypothetical protein
MVWDLNGIRCLQARARVCRTPWAGSTYSIRNRERMTGIVNFNSTHWACDSGMRSTIGTMCKQRERWATIESVSRSGLSERIVCNHADLLEGCRHAKRANSTRTDETQRQVVYFYD